MTAPTLTADDVFGALVGLPARDTADAGHDQAVSVALDQLGAQLVHDSQPATADLTGVARRLGRPDFGNWLHTVGTSAQGCARPVRLSGTSTTVNPRTGEVVESFSTAAMPDAALYKPCGSRLASACPACAETYRYDTYHLIASGLRGGKGVPESVAAHPAIFATFTAPSFGPVHAANVDRRTGKIRPCRPRRDRPVCPHGRPMSCPARHHRDAPCVGAPLCLDCYAHEHQVIWNAFAPKLWARTIDTLSRSLRRIAKTHGVTLKLRYAKVAEYQVRGVIHLHAIFRLDGHDPDEPEAVLPPPGCLSAADVCDLICDAASSTAVATPAHPDRPEGWPLVWGEQIDTRIVRAGIADAQITEQHVAGYLAKYATKSTETVGGFAARIAPGLHLPTDTHLGRLLNACRHLGRPDAGEAFARLRPKAHMLGFAGHFSTKSRRYSTTLGALRAARRPSARAGVRVISASEFDTAEHQDDDSTLVVDGQWTYLGSGWLTTADAALANASAAAARERRPARHRLVSR